MISRLKEINDKIDYLISEKKKISFRIIFVNIMMSIIIVPTFDYLPENGFIWKGEVFLYSILIPLMLLFLLVSENNIRDDQKYNFFYRKKIDYHTNIKYAERWYSIRALLFIAIILVLLLSPIFILQRGWDFLINVNNFVEEKILNQVLTQDTYDNVLTVISVFLAALFSGILVRRPSLFYKDGKTIIQRRFLKCIWFTAVCLMLFQIVNLLNELVSAYIFLLFALSFLPSCIYFIKKFAVDEYDEDFRIINKIDHVYWRRKYFFPSNKYWDSCIIEKLFCKQLDIKNLSKYEKQFNKIIDVEFHSVFHDCVINRKLALKKKIQIAFLLFYLFIVAILNTFACISLVSYILAIFLFLFQCISAVLIIFVLEKNHFMGYNQLYNSAWGYYVKDINNHIYFTNTNERKKTLIKEYKKIICLWNVIFQMKKEDNDFSIERIFDLWIAYLNDQFFYYGEIAKVCVPPFVVCLCLFSLHDDVSEKELKSRNQIFFLRQEKYINIIHQANLSQQEKRVITTMSLALIRDLYGNDSDYEKERICYMNLLDKYLERE